MSKACQIRVSSSGNYCCDLKHLTVPPGSLGSVNYANLPPVGIEFEVTRDNWIPADPSVIEGSGSLNLLIPGEYRFVFDCSELEGTEAPAEGAMALCYDDCRVADYDHLILICFQQLKESLSESQDDTEQVLAAMLACLAELKLLTEANNDAAALATLIAQMQAVCDKLLAAAEQEDENAAEQLDCLRTLKDQGENQLLCLEEIKALIECPPAAARGVLTTW